MNLGTADTLLYVMQRRKAAIVCLAVAGAGGLMVLSTWPWGTPVDVRVIKTEPAQMFDDAGAEMVLVTLGFNGPAHELIRVKSGEIEARIAGHWKMLENTLAPGVLPSIETRQEVIMVPGSADRCRIHLRYAGESIPYFFGRWLARRGVNLPSKYWRWIGPQPEGRNPHWKSSNIELPLEPSPGADRASNGAHNHTMQWMRASHSAQLQFGSRGELARTADGDR